MVATRSPDPGRPNSAERQEIALMAQRGRQRRLTAQETEEFWSWNPEARRTAAWPWLQDRRREGFEHSRRINDGWESDIIDGHDTNPYLFEDSETDQGFESDDELVGPDGWLTIRGFSIINMTPWCRDCAEDYAEPGELLCAMCAFDKTRRKVAA